MATISLANSTITETVSLLLLDTSKGSNFQPGVVNNFITYISTTSVPGRIATIRDATGYVSTGNVIILSTTKGVYFADGTTSTAITQPFGFVSFSSRSTSQWSIVNTFAFPDPLGTSYVSNVNVINAVSTSNLNVNNVSAGTITTRYISSLKANTSSINADTIITNKLSSLLIQTGSLNTNVINMILNNGIDIQELRINDNSYLSYGAGVNNGKQVAGTLLDTNGIDPAYIICDNGELKFQTYLNQPAYTTFGSDWASYPAINNLNMASYNISNVLNITNNGAEDLTLTTDLGTNTNITISADGAINLITDHDNINILPGGGGEVQVYANMIMNNNTNINAPNISSINISASNISTNRLFANTISSINLFTSTISSHRLFTSLVNTSFLQASTISTTNLFTNYAQASTISTTNLFTNFLQASTISTTNLFTNYIQASTISTTNIYTRLVSTSFLQASTVSTLSLNTRNISSLFSQTSSILTGSVTLRGSGGSGLVTTNTTGSQLLFNGSQVGSWVGTATTDLNMASFNINNVTNLNGTAVASIGGAAWSQYPATQTVNMNGFTMTNVNNLTVIGVLSAYANQVVSQSSNVATNYVLPLYYTISGITSDPIAKVGNPFAQLIPTIGTTLRFDSKGGFKKYLVSFQFSGEAVDGTSTPINTDGIYYYCSLYNATTTTTVDGNAINSSYPLVYPQNGLVPTIFSFSYSDVFDLTSAGWVTNEPIYPQLYALTDGLSLYTFINATINITMTPIVLTSV